MGNSNDKVRHLPQRGLALDPASSPKQLRDIVSLTRTRHPAEFSLLVELLGVALRRHPNGLTNDALGRVFEVHAAAISATPTARQRLLDDGTTLEAGSNLSIDQPAVH